MKKRIISIVLTFTMIVSICFAANFTASSYDGEINSMVTLVDAKEKIAQECENAGVTTKRYYFLRPDEWVNDMSDVVGIYWWEGTAACDSWPGYYAYETEYENIFYADVPADVTSIVWNNGLIAGTDYKSEIYKKSWRTVDISSMFYEPGENEFYPEGIPEFDEEGNPLGFDGMILIIGDHYGCGSPDWGFFISEEPLVWCYYYGDGTWGLEPEKPYGYNGRVSLVEGEAYVKKCSEEFGFKLKRYYFYMPEMWKNEYTSSPGVYWWEGCAANKTWPGYYMHETDYKNIYYIDVPEDVTAMVLNNGILAVHRGSSEFGYYIHQTDNIYTEYYDPDESPLYPDGIESFDGMILVVDTENVRSYPFVHSRVYDVEWYYYYGDGTCGTSPQKGEDFTTLSDEIIPEILGDVNRDGKINIVDVTRIQKSLAMIATLSYYQTTVADVNGDGVINIFDATEIQKYSVGFDSSLL